MAEAHEVSVERDVSVQMRDGVRLAADVYAPHGSGPFPVLLLRTPYGKTGAQSPAYLHPLWYARHGYIVVAQDVRGRGASGGEWYPFEHEATDGYDSVEWAAALPRSNERVGMYGFSYPGACELLAAALQPPHLACIVPAMTSSDYWRGWTYRGGALQQAFVQSWVLHELASDTARRRGLHDLERELLAARRDVGGFFEDLPLNRRGVLASDDIAPYYFDWLHHSARDDYWMRWSLEPRFGQIRVPALHIAGWYDIFLDGTIRNFLGIRQAGSPEVSAAQRLVIGPWYHMFWARFVADADFGAEARNDVDAMQIRWFDHWLKGESNGVAEEAPIRAFAMGANRWRSESAWPPTKARAVDLYLASGGAANSLNGDGRLTRRPVAESPSDVFVYDPLSPIPSLGGRSCCSPDDVPMGPANQIPVEIKNGVLVYTTPRLRRDAEVLGPVEVTLYAATSARDTDWTAKLVDVHHDGLAINLSEGIIRARYRSSWSEPELLEPGRCYEYQIELGATGNLFKAGHRIRLEISSSNFPSYDRNLNTGGPVGTEPRHAAVTATQQVFHDAARPSRLTLRTLGDLELEPDA